MFGTAEVSRSVDADVDQLDTVGKPPAEQVRRGPAEQELTTVGERQQSRRALQGVTRQRTEFGLVLGGMERDAQRRNVLRERRLLLQGQRAGDRFYGTAKSCGEPRRGRRVDRRASVTGDERLDRRGGRRHCGIEGHLVVPDVLPEAHHQNSSDRRHSHGRHSYKMHRDRAGNVHQKAEAFGLWT